MAGKRSRGVARDQALRALTDGIARARTACRTPSWGFSTRRCETSAPQPASERHPRPEADITPQTG
ncbi:hypothetical protein [Streptomyces sp. F001]|uniref:hypothetical protein n=1 Tax=Streptomyces sp. F001 TaxID=1510026 RepID=UPI001F0F2A4A|nr:hypothetical protein [Streptomyces sp. F001]